MDAIPGLRDGFIVFGGLLDIRAFARHSGVGEYSGFGKKIAGHGPAYIRVGGGIRLS
jgi:hypothetical protein